MSTTARPRPKVAIVGLGATFPGAADVDAFWRVVAGGVDATGPVPEGRWAIDPASAVDPDGPSPDRVDSARGGFVEVELGEGVDPSVGLALRAGRDAWGSSRTDGLDRARIGVILGHLILPTESASAHALEVVGGAMLGPLGLNVPRSKYPPVADPAGEPARALARDLGLGGVAYTLDAACASSLYALSLAADELIAGRADLMLAGGVSRPDALFTQMGFSQLRALSKSGRPRPFDAGADGLVVGEGAGVFALKRLADAVRDGDTIHGLIAGAGLSNDLDGPLLAPSSEGQLRALRAAYADAGWRPADVDYVECHATGTPLGDAVELSSLNQLWAGEPGRVAIGSVKSNLGHALTAAGAAGVLKVLLAIRHRTKPPTANLRRPAPALDPSGPLYIPVEAEPWASRGPRRAAVSGFGFGGINAHLLIEEFGDNAIEEVSTSAIVETPIAVVGLSSSFDGSGAVAIPSGRFRIPPLEVAAMLPQQALMLRVAAEAADSAGLGDAPSPRTGVVIGLGLDPRTTDYHVRWALPAAAEASAIASGREASADLTRWAAAVGEAASPPLSADRTMGGLAGLVASRVARELRAGGPSFTVSEGTTSGLRALGVAAGLLRGGVVDRAIVGAVDFPGDPRSARNDGVTPRDGAIAMVIKRLDDAERDGDRVLAVFRPSGAEGYEEVFDFDEQADPLAGSGAASGLASLARVVAGLDAHLVPGDTRLPTRYWLRDRREGPRRASFRYQVVGREACVRLEGRDDPLAGWPERSESHHRPTNAIEDGGTRSARATLRGGQGSARLVGGPRPAGLFAVEADDADGLIARLDELSAVARDDAPIEALARAWWRSRPADPSLRLGIGLVAADADGLRRRIDAARRLAAGVPGRAGEGVAYSPRPIGPGELAFVFPGSGNHRAEMGRSLAAWWPHILDAQDGENLSLRRQIAPGTYWRGDAPANPADLVAPIMGQVAVGSIVADLLRSLGVVPTAAIGYSLGESAALVALRAWRDRDELMGRLDRSTLFRDDLAGRRDAARRAWGLAEGEPVDWLSGVVAAPADAARAAIVGEPRAYVLIVNTPGETVLGGDRAAVLRVVDKLGAGFIPLGGVAAVHCAAAGPVADAYRALHSLPTTPPPGIRFYSGATARAYTPDRESAADAVTANALGGFDFPAVVRRAYREGVRHFVEVGPGASCTRMIGRILGDEPHLAASVDAPGVEPVAGLLGVLAKLVAERYPLDLASLYGGDEPEVTAPKSPPILVPNHHPVPVAPPLPEPRRDRPTPRREAHPVTAPLVSLELAKGEAHGAYLRNAGRLAETIGHQLQFQMALIEGLSGASAERLPTFERDFHIDASPRPFLDREACLTFAVGRIGDVLGPDFAQVDIHPTRVRLPDEPLMLVDRVLEIEGTPRSMGGGRIVTEHDIRPDAWYLDGGVIPTCIAVESGQADLLLSGYLGIDFETKGLAVYRLLDAVVTFHRALPGPGETIHYDIYIDNFFRQGDTHLFRFRFAATLGGEPLLTMADGIAGFFTAEALAAGKGVVHTALDLRPMPGKRPQDWRELAPMAVESYDAGQVEALRRGDLAGAFGDLFAGLGLHQPMRLPGGPMSLVDRVVHLDPAGGRFGLGLIRAEADIRPDDWFMTCHFVDDRVMPGTLMFECCLHTLRIYLARLGWVGEQAEVVCEPVPGIASKLECRGQVIGSTRVVTYEVSIKEIGYGPEPYAVVDALMSADGRPIVEITGMSLRMRGLDRRKVESLWSGRTPTPAQPLFDRESITAFAVGKPSEAFGSRYEVFDRDRVIARLPGPPYQFLDRITRIEGAKPWVVEAGGRVVAEYDVPADAWYFEAERTGLMPFAVLLEVALQPCGWLAAYLGSALTSPLDLSFRNLGGKGVQLSKITPGCGTLSTGITITKVYSSGGMLIQHYDFEVSDRRGPVYRGDTYFGFFSKPALSQQVGFRELSHRAITGDDRRQSVAPAADPYAPGPMLAMIDSIDVLAPRGGAAGLGFARGTKRVDPSSWFFGAHFHQDPVIPGSLGLESFLLLLKVLAAERWGPMPMGLVSGREHRWSYRGQVVPSDAMVTVEASVTAADEGRRELTADGLLSVDGRMIYRMDGFTLGAIGVGR